jgi:hypothetical protein
LHNGNLKKIDGLTDYKLFISEKHLSEPDIILLIQNLLTVYDYITIRVTRSNRGG